MLLRRITHHVTDQNWFAVFIDFLIVVVGVLIAFQITTWNEARQQKHLYNDAFERVVEELKQNERRQSRTLSGVPVELPIIQQAIEDIQVCRSNEQALANIKEALIPLNAPYGVNLETGALEQFLSNDDFLPFQSESTRQHLSTLYDSLSFQQSIGKQLAEEVFFLTKDIAHIVRPGSPNYASLDEFSKAFNDDSLLSKPSFRDQKFTVPLSEACQDQALLDTFHTWESQALILYALADQNTKDLRETLEFLESKP